MLKYPIKDRVTIVSILSYSILDMKSIGLGKKIKEFRGKLNLSQDQLAKKANIPFSTLVKIESGYTPNPSIETLIKIADAFNVSIDELIGRKKFS
jgi:transcriptional regulator with XRE-family HTH domain